MSLTRDKSEYVSQAKVDTLDNSFANLPRLKLLKIDAEGMEVNVLKGGLELIKRTKPILYVENDMNHIHKSKDGLGASEEPACCTVQHPPRRSPSRPAPRVSR